MAASSNRRGASAKSSSPPSCCSRANAVGLTRSDDAEMPDSRVKREADLRSWPTTEVLRMKVIQARAMRAWLVREALMTASAATIALSRMLHLFVLAGVSGEGADANAFRCAPIPAGRA
jgi:hypothetical protein